MNKFALVEEERVASIRDIQKNPSAALQKITRVMRGSQTIGFFLSNEEFGELVENQEAMMNPAFRNRVTKARKELKSGKGKSLAALAKEYGV